ncbi:MAG: PQQ-binding-like beta-propeller repeat protein [Candidatus Firestonebacteria bacterium]
MNGKIILLLLLAGAVFAQDTGFPQFRGADRNGIAAGEKGLAKTWGEGQPQELWKVPVAGGFSSPVIYGNNVYIMDYENGQDIVRCLSLETGKESWKYSYEVSYSTKNYGATRTAPAVNDKYVVTIGPGGNTTCLDAGSGKLVWNKDMVKDFGTRMLNWNLAQNPLIDGENVILAPAGRKVLMASVKLKDGAVEWTAENNNKSEITHGSITPMNYKGRKMYLYCASNGVYGISSNDGKEVFFYPGWTVKTSNIPAPLPVGEDKIFLTGGYRAGAVMLKLEGTSPVDVKEAFRLEESLFGSRVQTPVLFKNMILANRESVEFVCIDLEGKVKWTYSKEKIGLCPFMVADGMMYIMTEKGRLLLADISESGIEIKSKASVVKGQQIWGPMAISNGKLL